MPNSQTPQSEEEDGLLTAEEGADDKFLVEEDYLGGTLPEPQARAGRLSKRDDRKTLEGVWQAVAADPAEGDSNEEADSYRGSPNKDSNEEAQRAAASEEYTEKTGVSPGADDTASRPSPASRTKLNEKDTPHVMVNESRVLSGQTNTEFHPEEEQRLNPGRKEGEFYPPFAPMSRAATMPNGADRDQLLSAGGPRTPVFLTDRSAKPLSASSSPYPQPYSPGSPANEEEAHSRRPGHSSNSNTARLAVFDTLENGPRIREGFDRVTNLMAALDEKLEKLVGDHERDFLLAYRTQMYAIQQQMEYFKRKADEEQAKILRDMKVRSLEKELSWFMSEALRLDGLCKHYQSNLEKWRARAEALAEDRNFLETQIKTCKRQSRVLQAKVDGKS